MTQYIDKSAVVAEIKRLISIANSQYDLVGNEDIRNRILWSQQASVCSQILSFLDTLEVKETHEDIDVDLNPFFEELGVEPDSRFAAMFKEAFYKGVDNYLNKKENK